MSVCCLCEEGRGRGAKGACLLVAVELDDGGIRVGQLRLVDLAVGCERHLLQRVEHCAGEKYQKRRWEQGPAGDHNSHPKLISLWLIVGRGASGVWRLARVTALPKAAAAAALQT